VEKCWWISFFTSIILTAISKSDSVIYFKVELQTILFLHIEWRNRITLIINKLYRSSSWILVRYKSKYTSFWCCASLNFFVHSYEIFLIIDRKCFPDVGRQMLNLTFQTLCNIFPFCLLLFLAFIFVHD